MKTVYISPMVTEVLFRPSYQMMAGSGGGRAVADDGSSIDLSGFRSSGDASSAAARGSSFWDDDE